MSFLSILAIGSGGFLGAISRAYLNGVFGKMMPNYLPFGTLGVNLLGSLLLGCLFALFAHTSFLPTHLKSFLTTGFMGALTTYSTFAYESFLLFEGGAIMYGVVNVALNAIGTILCAGTGYKVVEYLLNH